MKWTQPEKDSYARVVGLLMKGDQTRKEELDSRAKSVISVMRQQMPGLGDEELSEFSAVMSTMGAHFIKATLVEAAKMAKDIYEVYSVATAQLIGSYDPDSGDVPDCKIPELLGALGFDAETSGKIWDMVNNNSQKVGNSDASDIPTGQYL